MSLRSVNLNLLPVLRALLRLQNVSAAATELNLSQPTISVALAQLRGILNDPLLIRIGRKMELTARARALIGPVEEACASLETVLLAPEFFPAHAVRRFVIASADDAPVLFGPRLLATLRAAAPGITVQFIAYAQDVAQQHRLAEIDLVILPRSVVELFGQPELRIRSIYTERFVHVVSAALAGADGSFNFATIPHAVYSPRVRVPEGFGDAYGMAVRGQHVARFEQLTALPLVAALGGMAATMPSRLAHRLAPALGLAIIAAGLPDIDICMTWSPLLEADPAHRWFRETLAEIAKEEWS
jgi:DNA-binding transcriptional LysR family regulator